MFKVCLAMLALAMMSSGLAQGANLLQNGSFESPVVTGMWNAVAVPHWLDWPSANTDAYLSSPVVGSGDYLLPLPDGAQALHSGVTPGQTLMYFSQISTGTIDANSIYRFSIDVFAYDSGRVRFLALAISKMAAPHTYLAGGLGQELRVPTTFTWTNLDFYYNSYTIPGYNGLPIGVNMCDYGFGDWWFDNAKLIRLPVTFYGFPLTSPNIVLTEGASFSYRYIMKEAPAGTVTVTIIPDANGTRIDLGNGAGASKVLTFNAGNWNVPQTVTATAVLETTFSGEAIVSVKHQVTGVAADDAYLPNLTPIRIVAALQCGDWGYLPYDINQDCKVDMADFAQFATEWLMCTDPQNPACVRM